MLSDREIRRGIQELTIERHRHCTTRHTHTHKNKNKKTPKHQITTKKPKQTKTKTQQRKPNGEWKMTDPETQDTVQIKKNSTEKTEWSMKN